ncbi:putative membrane protein [Thermosporothrix hazakensis]|jgi:uncharacterized membrane protein|uniref:VKOR family protein n=2 Tax=Thermosporothrix TaxID=768650 RepID=A0A455SUX4_9CHLR|nr:vitamin K epoxide reductase family protein [Thermosporothrix hazakensis]PZW32979.1 putative membrane protein [Thermosporothrix hazakensis]BBH90961.1 VKOR family protein [Thermosporothrix sp. COM3]GCE49011.1 VKOR family protein [Thermosporothrix hazakensis]
MKRSIGQLLLFVLSIAGLAISAYLVYVHFDSKALVCSNSGYVNCESVLTSSRAFVPGTRIPIAYMGVVWFVVSGVIAFLAWKIWPQKRGLLITQLAWAICGILSVLYLVYLEIVVLNAICAWCTAVHVIILAMLLLNVILFTRTDADEEYELEEEDTPSLSSAHK